jgi:hypothetical protein
MKTNHRLHERVPVLLDIELERSSGNVQTRISEISMGGCFIDSNVPVIEGEVVTFRTFAPGGRELKLTGEVVYLLPNEGFGVRFNPLSENEKLLFEQIIFALLGRLLRRYTLIIEEEKVLEAEVVQKERLNQKENESFSELTKSIQEVLTDAESKEK